MLIRKNPSYLKSPCIEDSTGGNNSIEEVKLAQNPILKAQLPVQVLTRKEINRMLDDIRSLLPVKTLDELRRGSDSEILAEIKRLGINFYQ